MSKIKFSSNLFVEINELNRMRKMLDEDGYKKLIKTLVSSFGIVQNAVNDNLKPTIKSGTSNTIIVKAGIAFDTNLNAITLDEDAEIIINDNGLKKWVIVEYSIKNEEVGTVNVTANGTLQGFGTEFTKVLRSQVTDFPTKVRLTSQFNQGDYEVLQISSDNMAIISGTFMQESGLKYSVIGTFTPGFIPLDYDKLIYEYDSCLIYIVESEDVPIINEDQYILASLTFDLSGMTLIDCRNDYMFNDSKSENSVIGITKLKTDNLASLTKVTRIEEKRLELVLEHGYDVNNWQFLTNTSIPSFQILSGVCNYFGTGDVPNDFFAGWVLLNRKTMKSVYVNGNTNKILVVPKFSADMINGTDNDFVIIPDYSEIEFEVLFSGDDSRSPIHHKLSIHNITNRFDIPIEFGTSNISIKYRLISDYAFTVYNSLAIANFTNVKGDYEVLANSSFNVNIIATLNAIRNYS